MSLHGGSRITFNWHISFFPSLLRFLVPSGHSEKQEFCSFTAAESRFFLCCCPCSFLSIFLPRLVCNKTPNRPQNIRYHLKTVSPINKPVDVIAANLFYTTIFIHLLIICQYISLRSFPSSLCIFFLKNRLLKVNKIFKWLKMPLTGEPYTPYRSFVPLHFLTSLKIFAVCHFLYTNS